MVKPLSFKGDAKPKKRKRTNADDLADAAQAQLSKAHASNEAVANNAADADAGAADDSWVSAEAVTDISGPVIFVLPTSPVSCIASDALGKVFCSAVENMVEDDPSTAEPHDVRQVWVANRVAGTESFSFKGHHGRYLAVDKFGVVSATKEAISPEESFVVVPVPDHPAAFSLQTVRDGFVTVGPEVKDVVKTAVRGDAEVIGFQTTLRVRMQARFKPRLKQNKADKAIQKITRKELEEAVGRSLDDEEVKKLKKARKAGDYHEALLDVKVKGKHDKFA